ncbi:putative integral membrane protein [Actinosynnema pretiosum]|nr:putative integral membrane protein [Actinosynnema pretiosum]
MDPAPPEAVPTPRVDATRPTRTTPDGRGASPAAPGSTVPGSAAPGSAAPTPTPTPAPVPADKAARRGHERTRPTRISGAWVAVVASAVVLLFLLVFILQNQAGATITFLGGTSTLPLGVALLLSAIAGALLVALVGAARILQLRREARKRAEAATDRR